MLFFHIIQPQIVYLVISEIADFNMIQKINNKYVHR